MKNKKGQTGGLITALVFGIATLIVGIIIAFLVVNTLSNANLLTSSRTTNSTSNESDIDGPVAYINETGYVLDKYDNINTASISITSILGSFNQSNGSQQGIENGPQGFNVTVSSGNYTVTNGGVIYNATTYTWSNVSITYVITDYSDEELATNNLDANFSEGTDRISSKIPTVLLVAAIVLILGVLAILVGVWQRMKSGEFTL